MKYYILFFISIFLFSCQIKINNKKNDNLISVIQYKERLKGFWLGQCIANMTGLVTEMDKIGNIGKIKTGKFYTSDNWGKLDQPSIFDPSNPSLLSKNIDFVFEQNGIWPADDDTDIEYMYQELLFNNKTAFLTPSQIKNGWQKHIKQQSDGFLLLLRIFRGVKLPPTARSQK